jgi:hypothetical protein
MIHQEKFSGVGVAMLHLGHIMPFVLRHIMSFVLRMGAREHSNEYKNCFHGCLLER